MLRNLSVCVLVAVLSSSTARSATYLIEPDGSGDFPTIQAAIDAAVDGDIIELTEGTFIGEGNRDVLVQDKNITIRSQSGDPATCIIDPEGGEGVTRRAFVLQFTGPNFVIENITISGGSALGGSGSRYGGAILLVEGASPTITGCVFASNQAERGGAVYAHNGCESVFTDCTFEGNHAVRGGGAYFEASNTILFENCLFDQNAAVLHGGAVYSFGTPSFGHCTFSENYADGQGGAILAASVRISGCAFSGNAAGGVGGALDFGGGSEVSLLHASTFIYNSSSGGGTINYAGTEPVGITNTIIAYGSSGPALSCTGTVVPDFACCDLYGNAGGDWLGEIENQHGQDGNISLDPEFCDPANGDLHLNGTSPCAPFSPPNDGCDLIGALPIGCGPNQYIVMADGSGDYPTIQGAVDAAGEGETVVLGDGTFLGSGNRDIDLAGKGITIRSMSGDPMTCVIDCQGSESDPHRGFRLDSGETSATVLQGITIKNGHVEAPGGLGGAILCKESSPRVIDCVFEDNQAVKGGAVWCEDEAAPELSGCVFASNTAQYAGALGCDFALPSVRQCTFVGNQATGTLAAGAGIECWNHASVTVENTILAFGLAGQGVRCHETASIELSCSDVFGNANGDWVGCIEDQFGIDGNISADPQFCDLQGGDYHLWNYSPCSQYSCGLIGALPVNCWDVQDVHGSDFSGSDLRLAVTPNPAFGPVTLGFEIPAGSVWTIEVFDSAGRVVRVFQATSHVEGVSWSQTDRQGKAVPAGIYYARLTAGARSVTRTAVVVR